MTVLSFIVQWIFVGFCYCLSVHAPQHSMPSCDGIFYNCTTDSIKLVFAAIETSLSMQAARIESVYSQEIATVPIPRSHPSMSPFIAIFLQVTLLFVTSELLHMLLSKPYAPLESLETGGSTITHCPRVKIVQPSIRWKFSYRIDPNATIRAKNAKKVSDSRRSTKRMSVTTDMSLSETSYNISQTTAMPLRKKGGKVIHPQRWN
jgi:hypothetical protein